MRDKNSNGYISAKDFEEILLSLKSYLLTPFVRDNIITVRIKLSFEGRRPFQIVKFFFLAICIHENDSMHLQFITSSKEIFEKIWIITAFFLRS